MSNIPTQKDNPNGLHQRYIVSKVNGKPIDHKSEYFVLRVDNNGGDPIHIAACRAAVLHYAFLIKDHLPQLSTELFERYGDGFYSLSQFSSSAVANAPSIIQSAFKFENGRRIIVYTSAIEIKTFECDENWKHAVQPYATSPLYPNESSKDYHLRLRNEVHKPECFVPEYSTNINS